MALYSLPLAHSELRDLNYRELSFSLKHCHMYRVNMLAHGHPSLYSVLHVQFLVSNLNSCVVMTLIASHTLAFS